MEMLFPCEKNRYWGLGCGKIAVGWSGAILRHLGHAA
jgi:hypothetical protein